MAGISSERLSVVIAVYQCADCLEELHRRLTDALSELGVNDYEVVFVDDRSRDAGWQHLTELARSDHHVRAIRLSRNFGQGAAVTAGVQHATGDWILVMDCDLQDRPEDIVQLVEAASGNDIVFTRRLNRDQTLFRRVAAKLYFRFRNAMLGIDSERELGSMVLMSRKVADAYSALRELDRQYALLLWWLGFKRGVIEVEHAPRFAGKSSYTLRKLIGVGLEGIFFQSSRVLQWIVYAGLVIGSGGLVLAAVAVVEYLTENDTVAGWTSLIFVELVLGGAILVSLGVAGLYVGRVFEQTKERPLYVVDEQTPSKNPAT